MTDTRLPTDRYLELIDADTDRLVAMGERGLQLPVPCCPGWDVAEVLWHTAGVFEHKVRVMADRRWPDPWPPEEFQTREETSFLRDAKAHLLAEFARHDVSEQTETFGDDTTIGFWVRRMALEVAVHRYDAELAHGDPTRIPDDEALDGIDEILRVMLAGPWWETRVQTDHPVDAVVEIASGSRLWTCDVRRTRVSVSVDVERTADAAATIRADPMPMFLWLWGRVPDSEVTIQGDAPVAAEFRQRLVECSG